jgi:beta-galactosidase
MLIHTGLFFKSIIILSVAAAFPLSGEAQRTIVSLNGTWDIEDSKEAEALPVVWNHHAPVPGLAHSAEPAFSQVDQFDSRMLIQNRVRDGKLPKSAVVYNAGVSRQDRNWFWYHRTFEISATSSVAILRINKAQFGAAVWLNGVKIGDHLPCFTAAVFDVSQAIRQGQNELIVRVGAHPGVLPTTVSGGTDYEKIRWTPGIYDNVSLALSENPAIESVQVAPKIADSSIVVQTSLHNFGKNPVSFDRLPRRNVSRSNLAKAK